jgi:hypothetical protein
MYNEFAFVSTVRMRWIFANIYCHVGWRTLVLKCNKNNYGCKYVYIYACIHIYTYKRGTYYIYVYIQQSVIIVFIALQNQSAPSKMTNTAYFVYIPIYTSIGEMPSIDEDKFVCFIQTVFFFSHLLCVYVCMYLWYPSFFPTCNTHLLHVFM